MKFRFYLLVPPDKIKIDRNTFAVIIVSYNITTFT